MDTRSKILLWATIVLVLLSLSAVIYKTVILQDFETKGVYVEVDSEYTYAWFLFEGEEFELELDSDTYEQLEEAVLAELELGSVSAAPDFFDELKYNFEEAGYVIAEEQPEGGE